MHARHTLTLGLLWTSLFLAGIEARAEKLYYALDIVLFQEDGETTTQQMIGYFSCFYTPGDFRNGTGQFLYLDIPGTLHDHTDLESTFDPGSIEITLTNNLHDDGVDITLYLSPPLSPTETAALDPDPTRSSRFDIGGNGFYAGEIISGSVVALGFQLRINQSTPTSVSVGWTPDVPGCVLQQSPTLNPSNWTDAASGNPLNLGATVTKMFYRLVLP
jgi:hypothetical protein